MQHLKDSRMRQVEVPSAYNFINFQLLPRYLFLFAFSIHSHPRLTSFWHLSPISPPIRKRNPTGRDCSREALMWPSAHACTHARTHASRAAEACNLQMGRMYSAASMGIIAPQIFCERISLWTCAGGRSL